MLVYQVLVLLVRLRSRVQQLLVLRELQVREHLGQSTVSARRKLLRSLAWQVQERWDRLRLQGTATVSVTGVAGTTSSRNTYSRNHKQHDSGHNARNALTGSVGAVTFDGDANVSVTGVEAACTTSGVNVWGAYR